MTKAYYGNPKEIENTLESLSSGSSDSALINYRIDPAPFVAIVVNYNYSSDNIIGHNYTVNLNGVLAIDADESTVTGGFGAVIDKIHKIEEILSTYGGTLYITDNDYKMLLKASGGTLKSLNFDNSNNSWSKSTPYNAQIDFQEIELNDIRRACDNISIDEDSFAASLVDINEYKIKSFSDSWSFNIEETVYDSIDIQETEIADNLTFGISYNIQAVGQHYFVFDGTEQKLLPAWENARKFCTDRLYRQLTLKISQILDINGSENCDSNELLTEIYKVPADDPLLDVGERFYVFNEQINCSASESDGTFSVSYAALVKRSKNNDYFKHTFTINEQHNHGANALAINGQSNKSITVDGTIEGLVLGGLLYAYNGNFLLPIDGRITPSSLNYNPKYQNAINGINTILNADATDFRDEHKQKLGLTFENLNLYNGTNFCGNRLNPYPKPNNFTIIQNINEGSITYTAEYSTEKNCGQKYTNVSISINKSNPVVNTFNIPNGKFQTPMNPLGIGTILQYIGANTTATMDISIQGRDAAFCCLDPFVIAQILNTGTIPFDIPADINLPSLDSAILTKKSKDLNISTGSYTINLSYILCNYGCFI